MLRGDTLLALLVGKADLTGDGRRRGRDKGYPLAGSSTLNRLELGTPDAAAGCVDELSRIIEQLRARWPKVQIIVRGDSGFCREELMAWCEAHDVGYLLGLERNPRLEKAITKALCKSRRRYLHSRRFRQKHGLLLFFGCRLGLGGGNCCPIA